jgi:hypothetical protein
MSYCCLENRTQNSLFLYILPQTAVLAVFELYFVIAGYVFLSFHLGNLASSEYHHVWNMNIEEEERNKRHENAQNQWINM